MYLYDLVGGVYAEVAAKEPWCAGGACGVGGDRRADARRVDVRRRFQPAAAIKGANRILEEAAQQFDVLDSQSDFAAYRV